MYDDNPDDTSVNPLNIWPIFDFRCRRKLVIASGRGKLRAIYTHTIICGAMKNCDYCCRGLNPSRVDTDNTLLRNRLYQ